VTVFSDRFSEGALKNLGDGFPPDEEPYTDSYEYFSDSDLDEEEGYTEAGGSLRNKKPHTESRFNLSDSDLDNEEGYVEASEPPSDNAAINNPLLQRSSVRAIPVATGQESAQTRGTSSSTASQSQADEMAPAAGDSSGRPETTDTQPGRVAIIRDMAATT